jgi:hypothetical protein
MAPHAQWQEPNPDPSQPGLDQMIGDLGPTQSHHMLPVGPCLERKKTDGRGAILEPQLESQAIQDPEHHDAPGRRPLLREAAAHTGLGKARKRNVLRPGPHQPRHPSDRADRPRLDTCASQDPPLDRSALATPLCYTLPVASSKKGYPETPGLRL